MTMKTIDIRTIRKPKRGQLLRRKRLLLAALNLWLLRNGGAR